jgi:signal transduction histidine kinase
MGSAEYARLGSWTALGGWTDRVRRLARIPHAPAFAVGVLALAAFCQAIVRAVSLAAPGSVAGNVGTATTATAGEAARYAVPFCLLALAGTVPLAFFRPPAAAVAVAAANALALAVFGTLTVAGSAAQVAAVYLLGVAAPAQRSLPTLPGWPTRKSGRADRATAAIGAAPGRTGGSWPGAAGTQYLAIGLAGPSLALALADDGRVAAMLLASLGPIAAGLGIAAQARREKQSESAAADVLAHTLVEHMARGERARIARELHDVVAHHISIVAVQAETARLTTPGLTAAGAQRFAEIGDTARAGLTEMRRLLGVLREDAVDAGATIAGRHPQPGLAQLGELIDAAREAAGTGTRLIVSGQVTEFDPGVELAAYRIVQEALTNARRHAPGAAVDVELRYAAAQLSLRIRDNGPGPGRLPGNDSRAHARARGTSGHGLIGMGERAVAAGGSLRTGTAPGGGFLVEADLPARPDCRVLAEGKPVGGGPAGDADRKRAVNGTEGR